MDERRVAPVEPLNEALERIRLEGAIFMRCEFSERWALRDLGGPGRRDDASGRRAPGPVPRRGIGALLGVDVRW